MLSKETRRAPKAQWGPQEDSESLQMVIWLSQNGAKFMTSRPLWKLTVCTRRASGDRTKLRR
jgi:hypothetical protein